MTKPFILDGSTPEKTFCEGVTPKGLRFAAKCDIGIVPDPRKNNEDRVLIDPDHELFLVVDGVGGYGHGDTAAQMIIDSVEDRPFDIRGAMFEASLKMKILMRNPNDKDGPGACFLADAFGPQGADGSRQVQEWSAGDVARILEKRRNPFHWLFRQFPHDASHDDTLVQSMVDDGQISREEAMDHHSRNIVLNYIDGMRCNLQHAFFHMDAGRRLLIYSDGIGDNLAPDEVLRMGKGLTPKELIDRVWEVTAKRMMNETDIRFVGKKGWLWKAYEDGYRLGPKKDNRGMIVIDVLQKAAQ